MKVLQSLDHNRTNPLSVIPGGDVVEVTHRDGTIIYYDKIKNVKAYVKATSKNPNAFGNFGFLFAKLFFGSLFFFLYSP